jgi:hypothetical protein
VREPAISGNGPRVTGVSTVTRREGDPDLKGWFGFGRKVSGSYPPPVAKGRLGTKQPPSTYETNAPSGPCFRREPPRKRGQVFGGQSSRQTLLRKFNPPLLLRRRRDRHNARHEDDAGGH